MTNENKEEGEKKEKEETPEQAWNKAVEKLMMEN